MASNDWKRWCRGHADIEFTGDGVVVTFVGGRHHQVEVEDAGEAYELTGLVARRADLQSIPDANLRAWERNRVTKLVGFRVDRRGRLIGNAWAPKPGMGADEFLHYVRCVALECDRFEFILTGKDYE
jgi:hypothetical protein